MRPRRPADTEVERASAALEVRTSAGEPSRRLVSGDGGDVCKAERSVCEDEAGAEPDGLAISSLLRGRRSSAKEELGLKRGCESLLLMTVGRGCGMLRVA